MLKTKVDTSDLDKFTSLQRARINSLAQQMLAIAEKGAELAIATKTYRDRSFHLTDSTIAYIAEASENRILVNLDMGMPYASYIIDKDLSEFPDIADQVANRISGLANSFTEAGGSGFVVSQGTFTGPAESFYT